jgi:hypothetical protein
LVYENKGRAEFLRSKNKHKTMKNKFMFLVLIVFVLTSIASFVRAATYYVDATNGNDSNNGLSPESAWKTIQKAANTVSAGDICLVLPGFYDERVQITTSGSPGLPITFEANGSVINHGFRINADNIRVTGFEISNTTNHFIEGIGIWIGGSYCEVIGNYIHDTARYGIVLNEDTSNCLVKDNIIYHVWMAGISIDGTNHIIEGNDISRTIQDPLQWDPDPGTADADGIRFFGSGHVIRKNYIHDIHVTDPEQWNPPYDPHIDAAQTWGPAYDIIFEKNIFEIPDYPSHPRDMQIAMLSETTEPVRDIVFRNNIFRNTGVGINIHGGGLSVAQPENIKVVNNVFFNFRKQGVVLRDTINATVMNNIFYDVGSHNNAYVNEYGFETNEGAAIGYNNAYMSDGNPPYGTPFPNDLWQIDPKFVDPVNGDYHLQPDSQAMDSGITISEVSDDLDGISRPQGSGYDIGAYEFQPEDITPPTIKNVQADPSSTSAVITWKTNEPADSIVKYGLSSGVYTNAVPDSENLTEHSVTLTGLSAETAYYFVVNSTDQGGNSNQSSEHSFTTTEKTRGVLHLDFDEGSGETAYDSSGFGNDCDIIGAGWTSESISGKALEFDGQDDYLDCGRDASLEITDEITIEAWVKPKSAMGSSEWEAIVNKYTGNGGFLFAFSYEDVTTLDFFLRYNSSTASSITVSQALPLNEWSHLVGVFGTDRVMRIYINGVQDPNTGTYDYAISPSGSNLRIGHYYGGYFNGTIDEVGVYSQALTPEEVLEQYKSSFHRADTNQDHCIETRELLAFIDRWKVSSKDVTMPELMEAIGLWNQGTGC